MSTVSQFEWPEGQVHDVGNSRVIYGRAVGMIVQGVPVIVITPDFGTLRARHPELSLDPRTCPAVRLEISKDGTRDVPTKG